MNEELKQYFRPEFLNRLDEIIVFRQLNRDEVKLIADIMLREVFNRMKEKGILLSVTEAFKERLVEEGCNPAWRLRRAVMRLLEDSPRSSWPAASRKANPPWWMSTTTSKW